MRASVIIKFLFKSTLLQDTNNFKPHTQEKKRICLSIVKQKNTKLPFWEDASSAKTQGKCKRAWLFFCRIIILHYSTCILSNLIFAAKSSKSNFFEAHIFMKISRKFPPSSHKCKKIELTFSNNHKDRYSPTRHSFVFCP